MKHTISLALVLASFWGLNSGHNTLLMISLGGVSIAFVLYLVHRMDVIDHESSPLHLSLKLLGYFVWLTKEIVIANISVAKHICLGNKSISPALTIINTEQKTDLGKVIYANSITLTPGTVAVDLMGNQILIHSLLESSVEELKAGEMDRRISRLGN